MNQIRYTIVIEDGALSGISQHTGNLDAVPLSLSELTELVPSINDAALATIAEKDARLTELETLRETMEAKVTAALQSGDPQQFIAVATEFCDPVAAKRQQLEASIAAAQAELNSLN